MWLGRCRVPLTCLSRLHQPLPWKSKTCLDKEVSPSPRHEVTPKVIAGRMKTKHRKLCDLIEPARSRVTCISQIGIQHSKPRVSEPQHTGQLHPFGTPNPQNDKAPDSNKTLEHQTRTGNWVEGHNCRPTLLLGRNPV